MISSTLASPPAPRAWNIPRLPCRMCLCPPPFVLSPPASSLPCQPPRSDFPQLSAPPTPSHSGLNHDTSGTFHFSTPKRKGRSEGLLGRNQWILKSRAVCRGQRWDAGAGAGTLLPTPLWLWLRAHVDTYSPETCLPQNWRVEKGGGRGDRQRPR